LYRGPARLWKTLVEVWTKRRTRRRQSCSRNGNAGFHAQRVTQRVKQTLGKARRARYIECLAVITEHSSRALFLAVRCAFTAHAVPSGLRRLLHRTLHHLAHARLATRQAVEKAIEPATKSYQLKSSRRG
jgi:hypothetical protein